VTESDTTVSTRDLAGAVSIAVTGPIDLASAPQVEAEIMAAVSNETAAVTLDLSAVDYLDSAGLRVVFRLTTRLAELRTGLEVVAPPGTISRRVIELSGYREVGTLRP
jgi:stage II sporulation protein AA (anti-sigma F factor antagonist)